MNNLKKFFALMLCLALMVTCFAGCHKKGEIAVKIGDIEFTSGYYACALVFADTEARAKVEEGLSEDELNGEIKYWKHQVEKTDYTEWVEKTALDTLVELAAIKTLCAENKVELDSETKALADSNAEYLWDTYGYSVLMESNGVAKDTFMAYMTDSYLADEYFEFLYGKGGEKEIAADKVLKQLTDNYVLVNKLEVSFSGLSEDQITEKKNQLAGYEASLKDGSQTFEQVYLAYNNIEEEDHKHEEAEEGETLPQDQHATVLGAEETDYASDYYDNAKDMAVGEVKLITLEDDEGLVLLVKKDIAADPYYIEEYDSTLRKDIVGDDYTDEIAEYGKKLSCDVNKSSTKQFKVKNITYPQAAY
ncbi:MAG: hypothetical protein IJN56_08705 [Clostridia bacterium]|nr:hypothetical protein [Clostridia bacterium]